MFFPFGDDDLKGSYKPVFTYLLIVINCLIFYQELRYDDESLNQIFHLYGAVPQTIAKGQNLQSLVTNMFLHGGWSHLIGNMLFLWIFADNIEITIGNSRFLIFYFLGGIFATLVHCYVFLVSSIPCIGASGAISAVLGAYLVMFPTSKIKVFFFFFIFRISAFTFLLLWIGQQLLEGWASIGPETANTSGVGYWAHIGGFGYGVAYGFYERLRKRPGSTKY